MCRGYRLSIHRKRLLACLLAQEEVVSSFILACILLQWMPDLVAQEAPFV